MARNAAVRSRRGCGDWIGHTDIWNDPRAQLAAAPAPVASFATEKQLAYLKSLFAAQKDNEIADTLRSVLLALYKEGTLTRKLASDGIAKLLANR